MQKAIEAVEIALNQANATRDTLITEANLNAFAKLAVWNQRIVDLNLEYINLGFTNFTEFITYKRAILVGQSNNAVVSI